MNAAQAVALDRAQASARSGIVAAAGGVEAIVAASRGPVVIAVFNQKGGVGKTTSAVSIAAALARSGREPIAIDLDAQACLTQACGVRGLEAEASVSAFFRNDRPLAELIVRSPAGHRVIGSHIAVSKVDALFGDSKQAALRLRTGIRESLAGEVGPILLDCSPALGVLSLNAILAAHRVLIPVSADYLALSALERLASSLKVLEKMLLPGFRKCVVVTRFDSRRRLSGEIAARIRALFGAELCTTRITENVALAEAPGRGKDIFEYAKSSHGARDYQALTEELEARGFFRH